MHLKWLSMPLPTKLYMNLILTGGYMMHCAARNDLSSCHNRASFALSTNMGFVYQEMLKNP
jgi:hypothetical protein